MSLRKLWADLLEGLGQAGAAMHGFPPLAQDFETNAPPATAKAPEKVKLDAFAFVQSETPANVRKAIDEGQIDVKETKDGKTLVIAACGHYQSPKEIIDVLAEKGAPLEGALSYAIRSSALIAATHLMNNYDQQPDFNDPALNIALGVAMYESEYDFCKALRDKGYDPTKVEEADRIPYTAEKPSDNEPPFPIFGKTGIEPYPIVSERDPVFIQHDGKILRPHKVVKKP